MKKTIDELLREIPGGFDKEYAEKKSCGCIKKEIIKYELNIEILRREITRYKAFYKPTYHCFFNTKPNTIGDNLGRGCKSLNEALENLKNVLLEKGII